MLKSSDILYENGKHWVKKADNGHGFEVYRAEITCSRRVCIVGSNSFDRAVYWCDRYESENKA